MCAFLKFVGGTQLPSYGDGAWHAPAPSFSAPASSAAPWIIAASPVRAKTFDFWSLLYAESNPAQARGGTGVGSFGLHLCTFGQHMMATLVQAEGAVTWKMLACTYAIGRGRFWGWGLGTTHNIWVVQIISVPIVFCAEGCQKEEVQMDGGIYVCLHL
eukprot:EG_transcript_28282